MTMTEKQFEELKQLIILQSCIISAGLAAIAHNTAHNSYDAEPSRAKVTLSAVTSIRASADALKRMA